MAKGNPINDIMQMRQQGLSNNQIIQNLQRNGYSNTEIFDAMNQVDTKAAVEGLQSVGSNQDLFSQPPVGGQEPAAFESSDSMQFSGAHSAPPTNQPPQPQDSVSPPMSAPVQQPVMQNMMQQDTEVKIEELVETIIEEKWEELLRDVNKIVSWKNKVESRLSEVEIRIDYLKESFSDLQNAIVGKVGEYDKHIMEVGSEIKAMEKVFSKILPAFTENVNQLSDIANNMKKEDKR